MSDEKGYTITDAAGNIVGHTDDEIPTYDEETIDKSELAELILLWEKKRVELDFIEESIERDVLALAETQKVGNVKVTYNKGRRVFDYHSPGMQYLDDDVIERYTDRFPEEIIPERVVVNWRQACKDNGVEPDIVTEGTPSAKITMVK